MSNYLTVHFHLKHYKDSHLPFADYMLLLLYENKQDWQVSEIADILSLSGRTITRMRMDLAERGYLKKEVTKYYLTDKLYPIEIKQ